MTRLALLTALLRRELGKPTVALIAASSLAGIWAADAAIQMLGAPLAGLFEAAIARFHITIQVVAALLVVLRISVRGQDDHSNGWLVPYLAGGGSRWFHSIAVATVTVVSMWLLFVAGAASFALALLVMGDSVDVLRLMPMLVLSGGLHLLGFAMLTTLVSLSVRDGTATIGIMFLLIFLPYVPYFNAWRRDTEVATWAELLMHITPSVYVPVSTGSWLILIGFAVVSMAAAAALGHLRTARYA